MPHATRWDHQTHLWLGTPRANQAVSSPSSRFIVLNQVWNEVASRRTLVCSYYETTVPQTAQGGQSVPHATRWDHQTHLWLGTPRANQAVSSPSSRFIVLNQVWNEVASRRTLVCSYYETTVPQTALDRNGARIEAQNAITGNTKPQEE